MIRSIIRFMLVLTFALVGCAISVETDDPSTEVVETFTVPITPSPTPKATETATEPAAVTITASPVPPTATPPATLKTKVDLIDHVIIDGDCKALERPITHTKIESTHELLSLVNNERCTLRFEQETRFTYAHAMSSEGIYGTIFKDDRAKLVRLNFDGTVTDLNVIVGGFFSGWMIASPETGQIVWADGDTNPENADQFLAQLWIVNSDGSDPKVIYQHITDLPEALLVEIFFPIGFHPNGDVLFSIEPAGRGGGWVYTGEWTNLYQTDTGSAEKTGEDLIFSCPDRTPFCIGDFTEDFAYLVHADREAHSLSIMALDTRDEIWSTTALDRTFIGQPRFNQEGDLAFVAVDVINGGNRLYPENGYIGLVDAPYNGPVEELPAELASDIITWVDNDQILYYELSSNSGGNWRYPIINREGEEIGVWQSDGKFPSVAR